MKPAKNVDEYIAQAPKEVQEKLQELLAAIKSPAPGAEECISYGMPYYDYKGRLVYFQLWKNHQEVSLFDVCTSRMRRNLVASIAAKLRTKLLLDCHRRNVACLWTGADCPCRSSAFCRVPGGGHAHSAVR